MQSYPLVNAPRPYLSQVPIPKRALPATAVNVGITALGLGMSVAGYYARKTDPGVILMGAGSSIVGAGIVLLILDQAGITSGGQV